MHAPKRFTVECRECSFGEEALRTEAAERAARDHYEATGHAVVAVERSRR